MISPGLEDVESLIPDESGPSLLGWLDVVDLINALIQCKGEKLHTQPKPAAVLLVLLWYMTHYAPHLP